MDKTKSLWVCVALVVALVSIVGSVLLFSGRDGKWKRLDYGELSFKVPDSWQVRENATIYGECLSSSTQHVVALETVRSTELVHLCPMGSTGDYSRLTLSVRPHDGIVDETYKALKVGQFDGVWKDSGNDSRIQNVVVIPQLKVEFEFDGDRKFEDTRRKILDTVRLKE